MTTVLVIDDEADVRTILRIEFEAEGYRVLDAPGAAQGLALLEQERPDVVLLDLRMPEMDGWAVLQAIKSREWPRTGQLADDSSGSASWIDSSPISRERRAASRAAASSRSASRAWAG